MIKHIAAACLLGTALASAPAFAQGSDRPGENQPAAQPSAGAASGQFLTQMSADQWRGSKLVGVDVYGSDNQKIGDVNEVIIDRTGQAKAIVIGVGGFLGIGEKNVAIPWEKVQWNMGGDQSSGMASNTGAGGQAPAERTTSREVAQTTTGSPGDPNAQPPQAASAGGATLSSTPSSGTAGNAPANSSPSVTSTTTGTSASGTSSGTTAAGGSATAGASSRAQDYPDRALVSMSKQDLQNAPEFRYASDRSTSSGAGGGSGTGSSSGR